MATESTSANVMSAVISAHIESCVTTIDVVGLPTREELRKIASKLDNCLAAVIRFEGASPGALKMKADSSAWEFQPQTIEDGKYSDSGAPVEIGRAMAYPRGEDGRADTTKPKVFTTNKPLDFAGAFQGAAYAANPELRKVNESKSARLEREKNEAVASAGLAAKIETLSQTIASLKAAKVAAEVVSPFEAQLAELQPAN